MAKLLIAILCILALCAGCTISDAQDDTAQEQTSEPPALSYDELFEELLGHPVGADWFRRARNPVWTPDGAYLFLGYPHPSEEENDIQVLRWDVAQPEKAPETFGPFEYDWPALALDKDRLVLCGWRDKPALMDMKGAYADLRRGETKALSLRTPPCGATPAGDGIYALFWSEDVVGISTIRFEGDFKPTLLTTALWPVDSKSLVPLAQGEFVVVYGSDESAPAALPTLYVLDVGTGQVTNCTPTDMEEQEYLILKVFPGLDDESYWFLTTIYRSGQEYGVFYFKAYPLFAYRYPLKPQAPRIYYKLHRVKALSDGRAIEKPSGDNAQHWEFAQEGWVPICIEAGFADWNLYVDFSPRAGVLAYASAEPVEGQSPMGARATRVVLCKVGEPDQRVTPLDGKYVRALKWSPGPDPKLAVCVSNLADLGTDREDHFEVILLSPDGGTKMLAPHQP